MYKRTNIQTYTQKRKNIPIQTQKRKKHSHTNIQTYKHLKMLPFMQHSITIKQIFFFQC
jgi:hypothetical protein